jgi:ubiquinone/menaquinone biosynthesis C-methylase UbiE
LDFGGGIGDSVPYVRHYFPGAALTCLDVSDRSLELARKRHGSEARFVAFDGFRIPFDPDSFDVAFAACVFHHIDATSQPVSLRELERVLRPGGHLFVFEHNPFNPLTRHVVNTCQFDDNAVLIAGRNMQRALRKAGFLDVQLRYRIFFPRLLSMMRWMEPYLTWLPLGAQYCVWGRKTGSL